MISAHNPFFGKESGHVPVEALDWPGALVVSLQAVVTIIIANKTNFKYLMSLTSYGL